MNPKAIAITLTASLLLSTGCAAKNRWFSRKDYSEVQDPFMEGSEVAAAEDGSGDTAGRAKLGSSAVAAADSGPKPITRPAASSTAVATSPASGSRTQAAYPDETSEPSGTKPVARSLSGSNLSQFLNSGGKSMPDDTAVEESAATRSKLAEPKSASARPSAGALSPAARAAAMPTLEEEEASFAGFMQKQSNAVNSAAQKAATKVQDTENSAADFASWASQQKAQWSEDGKNAVEAVKAAPSAARTKVRAVSHEAKTAVDNAAADFMNAAEFDSAEFVEEPSAEESAEPLFSQPAEKAPAAKRKAQPIPTQEVEEPEFDTSASSGATDSDAESNPFENPFDMEEVQPTKPPASKKSTTSAKKPSRPTIDESFEVDSGWKPSGVTPP